MSETTAYRAVTVGRGAVVHAAWPGTCAACGASANNLRSQMQHYSDDLSTVTCKRCLRNPSVVAQLRAESSPRIDTTATAQAILAEIGPAYLAASYARDYVGSPTSVDFRVGPDDVFRKVRVTVVDAGQYRIDVFLVDLRSAQRDLVTEAKLVCDIGDLAVVYGDLFQTLLLSLPDRTQ